MSEIKDVPYMVHEDAMIRSERHIRRLWILCILLVALLVGTNGAWLWYESQFMDSVTTTSIESNATDGGNATGIIGDSNEVNYGESESNQNR